MSKQLETSKVFHMRCDICGKEKDISVSNITYVEEFFTRKWSEIHVEQFPGYGGVNEKRLDCCPACTRKLKKLIRNVELTPEEMEEESDS